MSIKEPEISDHSIVLLGDFNVLIYQPLWFASVGLIRETEAEKAKIDIVHRDIVAFSLDWLNFNATPNKIVFSTMQSSYFEVLRDLALGITGVLEHTPIKMMGLNFQSHTPLQKELDWKNYEKSIIKNDILEKFNNARMSSFSLKIDRDYNDYGGNLNIKVEPSSRIKKGIFCSINDHYQLPKVEPLNSTEASIVLENEWNSSKDASEKYRELVISQYE